MVYVDDLCAEFAGMIMSHLIADTPEELLAMADRIGVDRRWIQKAGTWEEHFDICLSKRKLAVRAGALEVTTRELVKIMIRKDADALAKESQYGRT